MKSTIKNTLIAAAVVASTALVSVGSFASELTEEQDVMLLGATVLKERCVSVDPAYQEEYDMVNRLMPTALKENGIYVERHKAKVKMYSRMATNLDATLAKESCRDGLAAMGLL